MEKLVLGAGLFVFLAHFFDALFEKTRVPDILFLILMGVVVGSGLEWIQPDDFGLAGPLLGTITLVVILFESGLSLPLSTLAQAAGKSIPFAVLGFGLTVTCLSLTAHFLLDLNLWNSVLLGFILGGTSSAVVIPVVRGLKVSDKATTMLTLESAITDVLCIIGTVGIATGLASDGGVQTGGLFRTAAVSFLAAIAVGIVAALVWSMLVGTMRRMDSGMFTTLAYALIVYGLAETLMVSGPIAALTLGITLGNMKERTWLRFGARSVSLKLSELSKEERVVYGETVFLLKAFFFFYMGLTVVPADLLGWHGLCAGILGAIPLLPRVVLVRFFFDRGASQREALLAWSLVPRGLAAVVLANVPHSLGVEGTEAFARIVTMSVFLNITMVAVLVFITERGWLNFFGDLCLGGFGREKTVVEQVDQAEEHEALVPAPEDLVSDESVASERLEPEPESEPG